MAKISEALTYGLTIRESADDGSDFTNPVADYRRLFLGEDGQLHVKDSAGAVTGIGASISEIADLSTAETDTALVLGPDGAGGVEWRAESGDGGLWTPDTPPGSPNAADDEFNALSGWSVLGTLDVSNVTDFPGLWHVKRAVSSNINGIYKALPSMPFTVTAAFEAIDLRPNAHPSYGIMLLDATPTAIRSFEFNSTTGTAWNVSLRRYTNRTTFSTSSDVAIGAGSGLTSINKFYLRLVVASATDVSVHIAARDGLIWTPVTGLQNVNSTITPAYVGISVGDPVSACTVEAAVGWIRFT